jgi:hypothetical protein
MFMLNFLIFLYPPETPKFRLSTVSTSRLKRLRCDTPLTLLHTLGLRLL